MTITAGVDVGASGVQVCLMEVENPTAPLREVRSKVLALKTERIRRRLPPAVAREVFELALSEAGLMEGAIDYVASTGDGEAVEFRRGHFYGMTTHARGALYLMPEARAVLDMGALHARAISLDGRGKVLGYRMTSQCASGSGQFLENISRYLGITLAEVGQLSLQSDDPEVVSSICAVLAETDVINMVSRGLKTENIIKGIHQSMAGRLVKLLGMIKAEGIVALTGGLSCDVGLVRAIEESAASLSKMPLTIVTHPHAVYAGALGAALWGAYRHEKLLVK
ncbi:MAG: benzoyl-CoA reductase subunit D, partial [Planctomycetota bacterium]